MSIWQTLKDTPVASAIAESGFFFPALECIHVAAITIVVGVIAVVDMRLLGVAWVDRRVDDVAEELLLYTWIAFGLALVSGAFMFASKAPEYVANPAFRVKLLLLVLAGINMALFHNRAYRSVDAWAAQRRPVPAARLAGGLSLVLWVAILVMGRLIAFVAT